MTAAIAAILVAAIAVLAGLLLPPLLRRRRRRAAFATALAPSLRAALDRNVPAMAALPRDLSERLEGLVAAFLAEKRFAGCNGLVVTDEIRVTIAAQACLLLLGRPGSLYDDLLSILVYPAAFWVEDEVQDDDGIVTRRRRELSGEAWDAHRIILSWEDIEETAAASGDGYNVVLHEFAHHLDAEGRGPAQRARSPEAWHADLLAEFAAFEAAVDGGAATFLDPYAAEDSAEFFAVGTEDFIERPAALRDAQPRLYALLREFYGLDPAAWTVGDKREH